MERVQEKEGSVENKEVHNYIQSPRDEKQHLETANLVGNSTEGVDEFSGRISSPTLSVDP